MVINKLHLLLIFHWHSSKKIILLLRNLALLQRRVKFFRKQKCVDFCLAEIQVLNDLGTPIFQFRRFLTDGLERKDVIVIFAIDVLVEKDTDEFVLYLFVVGRLLFEKGRLQVYIYTNEIEIIEEILISYLVPQLCRNTILRSTKKSRKIFNNIYIENHFLHKGVELRVPM